MAHHNGKKTREKIRIRTYVDCSESYFEIKNKNNKGRTEKKRIPVENVKTAIQKGSSFCYSYSKYNPEDLKKQLYNDFKRITLVNKSKT
ncbi:MAG: VTC domain-containing protein, partial [Odoribacter sp.]|nr:VTC domain-containing protein [Odoribacter sp.]